MNADERTDSARTAKQIIARLTSITIVAIVFIGSIIWSIITIPELFAALNSKSDLIVINISAFYCPSMVVLSACALYMLLYELIKKENLPKNKMQIAIYILMIGVAAMVFLPRYATRYYINKVEHNGYSFNAKQSYEWLFYRKLAFTKPINKK